MSDEDDNGDDARHTVEVLLLVTMPLTRMIMVMMLDILGVLLLVTINNMVLVLVRRCCLRRHACGEGAAGHCCRLGDCHPPPHRTGWGYEYEYDNGRGGRSPPLADTSKCER